MKPDLDVIEYFLNRIGTRARHTLAFIHPNKTGLDGATYESNQKSLLLNSIIRRQTAGYGIYYSLNEGVAVFHQRGFNGKLLADEIINIHMLGFDVDWIAGDVEARKEFERLALEMIFKCHNDMKPNVIISSGGGIQLLYVLCAPLRVELSRSKLPSPEQARNDVVAKSFRDDFTLLYADMVIELTKLLLPLISSGNIKIDKLSNIDRVFRMPGTVNFPTAQKIERGATVRMASIIYDKDEYAAFGDLRDCVPKVTENIERKPPPKAVVDREGQKWSIYNKMKFLCDFFKEKSLVDDNENYTHALMFPLFGAINRREITEAQGRELWLLATSTARSPAYGTWAKKWDTRKIENYTGRDIGSMIYYCKQQGCLLPWSMKDQEQETLLEAQRIAAESLRNPILVDEDDLF